MEHITVYLHKPDYKYWSLSFIFYQLLRYNKLFCGLTTFYKYVSHKIIEAGRKKKPPKLYTRITSNHVFEKLHLDTTLLRLKNFTRVYITFVMDNFSRSILGYTVSLNNKATTVTELLKEVFDKHNLTQLTGQIIVDGGPEFEASFEEYVSSTNFTRLVAQQDIIQSNSNIEALNKIIKYSFLYQREFETPEELKTYLKEVIPKYQAIPKAVLFGLTPEEVLNGTIPDRQKYKNQITEAKKTRLAENRSTICCKINLPVLDG